MPATNSRPVQLKQELLKTVQSRIDSVRDREGITQAKTAKLLGMTQPRLSALVQGHLELFSLEALIGVANKLGMSVRLNISRPHRPS